MGTPVLREENAMRSSNVAMFQDHPCSQEPCHNGGRCNPQLDTYECVCLSGFSGGHCQNSEYLWPSLSVLHPFVILNIHVSISTTGLHVNLWAAVLAGLRSAHYGSVKTAASHCDCTNRSVSSSNIIWFYSKKRRHGSISAAAQCSASVGL